MKNKLFFNKNLLILYGITLIAVMGVTSIAPALPAISQSLGISPEKTKLLIAFFPLPGIFLSPFAGVIVDRFGRKRVLVPSLFLFAASGTACYFTNDFNILLILRVIQGIGATPLSTLNLIIISDLFKDKQRLMAMGYNGSVLSVGTLAYPAIGGAIALLGWHYPFLLSLLAVPVGLLSMFALEIPPIEKQDHIVLYLKNAIKSITKRKVYSLLAATLFTFTLLYGFFIATFPFYMDRLFKSSSLSIGLYISAASIGTMLFSYNLDKISKYIKQRRLIILAFCIYVISISGVLLYPDKYFILFMVFLYGAANGINMPNINSLIANNTTRQNRGALISVNSMAIRAGQFLGPALFVFFGSKDGSNMTMKAGALLAGLFLVIIILLMKPYLKEDGS